MKFFLNRLKEPSTWKGLTILLTLSGVSLSPELSEAIISAGAAIVSLIMIFTKEPTYPKAIVVDEEPVDKAVKVAKAIAPILGGAFKK